MGVKEMFDKKLSRRGLLKGVAGTAGLAVFFAICHKTYFLWKFTAVLKPNTCGLGGKAEISLSSEYFLVRFANQ